MAIRSKNLAGHVVGVGRRDVSLRRAADAGAVDSTTTDLSAGVRDADLVVLATPLSTFTALAKTLSGCMKNGAILSEVGSAKEKVVEAVTGPLQSRSDIAFVPTHPMAGSEKRGPENALSDLFEGATCIFTPTESTPRAAIDAMERLWENLGARVRFMSPQEHDILVARISHLPHLVASALITTIEEGEGAFAGGGLTDTTRVASGDPELWRAICESNPDRIIEALDAFAKNLDEAKKLIAESNFEALTVWLQQAKKKREQIIPPQKRT